MAYTAECLHGFHSACCCENACGCSCHAPNPDEEIHLEDSVLIDDGDDDGTA